MSPTIIHCKMEMIDLESDTSRGRENKKGMWVMTFMSSTSVSPATVTLMAVRGG